jgi:hypothetical protein
MATFTSSQTETLITTLTNGRKWYMVNVLIADNGTDATTITVNSLSTIIAWAMVINDAGDTATTFAVTGPTLNALSVDPAADATGAELVFFVVGV